MPVTLLRNLDWAIAWDEASASHVYKRGIDLAFDGPDLVYIGPAFAGKADKVIDGSRLMAMPGLVDIHSHPGHEPVFRGMTYDIFRDRWDLSDDTSVNYLAAAGK